MTKTETPWDAAGFWDAVNESCTKAAELHYIDLAVAYLKDPAFTVGDEETYGPTVPVRVTLGWTYPVHVSVHRPASVVTDGWVDRLNETLQGFVEEGASWAKTEFAGYGDTVADAALPHASVYEAMATRLIDDVADAMTTTIPAELSTALNLGITSFYGSTAESFRADYVDRFGAARENQIWVAAAAGVVSAAAAGIIKQAQHSLMNLVCTVRDTLEAQLLARPSEHSGVVEVATILMLASEVSDVLGFFKLPDAVEEAISKTMDYVSFAQRGLEFVEEKEFSSTTAEELVTGLYSQTATVMTRYDNLWAGLQTDQVADLQQKIHDMPSDKPFFPPRPDLADGAGPGDFYYENSPLHDGP